MARPISVRGLTEGAILAALVAVLALAANYVPLVGLAANFLCPIPLAVLMIRHGLRVAALATVVAIAIGSAISGPVTGVLILLGFAPVGLAIGFGLRRQWSASTVIVVGGGAVLGALVLGGVAAKVGIGVAPRVFAREVIELNKRSFDDAVQRYGRLGLDARQMDASVTMMRDFFDYSYRLIPMLLLVGSFISAYLNYEVARHVLRRVGVKAPALPPMSMWGLPAIALWALPLLSLLAALGARRRDGDEGHSPERCRRAGCDWVGAGRQGRVRAQLPLPTRAGGPGHRARRAHPAAPATDDGPAPPAGAPHRGGTCRRAGAGGGRDPGERWRGWAALWVGNHGRHRPDPGGARLSGG